MSKYIFKQAGRCSGFNRTFPSDEFYFLNTHEKASSVRVNWQERGKCNGLGKNSELLTESLTFHQISFVFSIASSTELVNKVSPQLHTSLGH